MKCKSYIWNVCKNVVFELHEFPHVFVIWKASLGPYYEKSSQFKSAHRYKGFFFHMPTSFHWIDFDMKTVHSFHCLLCKPMNKTSNLSSKSGVIMNWSHNMQSKQTLLILKSQIIKRTEMNKSEINKIYSPLQSRWKVPRIIIIVLRTLQMFIW